MLANDFAKTIVEVVKLLSTAWMLVPSPFTSGSGTSTAPAQDATASWLQGDMAWFVGVSMVLGVAAAVIAAIFKVARGRHIGEDVVGMLEMVLRVAGVALFGEVMIGLAMAATSAFSTWILNQAGTSFQNIGAAFTAASFTAISPGLVIVLGIVVAVGGLIQVVVVAGVAVGLPLLAGVWPVSAAWSGTALGNQAWKKHTSWIVAAVLYKPAAAVIYAVAFKMFTGGPVCLQGTTACDAQSGSSELSVILGTLLILMAALALPALLRLISPAASMIGGISGGEALAAGAALATGAAMVFAGGGAAAGAGSAGGGGLAAGRSGGSQNASGASGAAAGSNGGGGPPDRGGGSAATGAGSSGAGGSSDSGGSDAGAGPSGAARPGSSPAAASTVGNGVAHGFRLADGAVPDGEEPQ